MFRMKMSQIDTEKDKNLRNLSIFNVFMHFFAQTLDRLCGLEGWKGSTRKECVVQ